MEADSEPVIEDENIDSYDRHFQPKIAALVENGTLTGDLSFLGEELSKQGKGNAKAVELLDMDGNHLAQFRSVCTNGNSLEYYFTI